jgi:anti-sigma regulatory factor (Ser/Thr protein kinase)
MTGTRSRCELAAVPDSVREARRFVRDAVRDWGLTDLEELATLLTSELATNAVVHARTRFAVVVARLHDGLEVHVLDDSPAAPNPRQPRLSSQQGRGLAMVAKVAAEWGPSRKEDLDGFVKGVRFVLGTSQA